jgi:hypothetical protein
MADPVKPKTSRAETKTLNNLFRNFIRLSPFVGQIDVGFFENRQTSIVNTAHLYRLLLFPCRTRTLREI